MDFDSISTGIMFIFDNYNEDEELQEYIEGIDCAENDNDIRRNVNEIISILDKRCDKNVDVIKQLFKSFI